MLNRREAMRLLAATPMVAGESRLLTGMERTWIGPEYWANPLQDWRLRDGRIECTAPGGDRNVYLLTHEVTAKTGTLSLRVPGSSFTPTVFREGRYTVRLTGPGGELLLERKNQRAWKP